MKYNNDKSALFKWVEYIFLIFYALKFIVPYAVQLTTVFTFMNVTDLLWFIALGLVLWMLLEIARKVYDRK